MPDKPKILVVDDSIAIVNSLQSILTISGYSVDTAFNGSDALRKIYKNEYDLVICDIEMPGVSGLEFLSRVRQDFENSLDVILMTGYLEHDYFIEAIRLGASDFIRKPIDTKQMIHSIKELMFRKRSRDDISGFFSILNRASFDYEFNVENFTKFAISKVFSAHLRHRFKVNAEVLNELLVCVDEMVYNAYIHGTLGLSVEDRALGHDQLQSLITQKIQDPEINARVLRLSFSIDNITNVIEITVEDQGQGFDYEHWLNQVKSEPILDIKEHGRGLSLLYHLSDKIVFAKQGRMVTIQKSLLHTKKDES
ncbi:MAG: response regulator [Candidatus Cloacimonadaceae bacterium]|nr:response regulator [Candidatus Cloacimonadota bacterium]MDD4666930.1 response regulator [Candidatus Cloacimonadota bacterium]HPF08427.1 response regulator [Candidatus Cloacimonadota bacterium]